MQQNSIFSQIMAIDAECRRPKSILGCMRDTLKINLCHILFGECQSLCKLLLAFMKRIRKKEYLNTREE